MGLALSVALGLPLIRVLVALLYGMREANGTLVAMSAAAAVFSAPLIAVAMRRAVGSHAAIAFAIVGLAAAAIGVQVVHPIAWWLAGSGVGCALGAWTLLLHASRASATLGRSSFAIGFMLGLAIDTAVHASFRTWDAAWQSTATATIVTLALTLASLATTPMLLRTVGRDVAEGTFAEALSLAALGPFLALQVLFLHNVAFVGATAGTTTAMGAATVLAGCAVAIVAIAHGARWSSLPGRSAATGALVAIVWALPDAPGIAAVIGVIVAAALSGALFTIAIEGRGVPLHEGALRTGLAATMGTLTFASVVFLYQIHASQPLPFSNRFVPALAAALIGVATTGATPAGPAARAESTRNGRLVTVAVALLVAVPLFLVATRGSQAPAPGLGRSMRVVSWNVHSAVDAQGQVVPDEIARTIAAQRPDVVVLQEVSRGWPVGGSLDLAAWLSARLGMPFVWGPAADGQFGNVVMSRAPILESAVMALPFGSGPQHRSSVSVVIDAGDATVTVIGTHLETGPGTDTRARQIEVVLGAAPGDARTIVAGDMNMQPADEDTSLFFDAGFRSAQDEAGRGASSTARDPMFPGDRPDWILGSPDLTFSNFAIVASNASDHRLLVVTVSW